MRDWVGEILKLQENNLGLNKRIQKSHSSKSAEDATEDVAIIQFEDPEVERICHEHGVYTIKDAAKVSSLVNWFQERIGFSVHGNKKITRFNEFKYFTSIKALYDNVFFDCRNLKSIELPESLERIWYYAFQNCISLERIVFPDSLKEISPVCLAGCLNLREVRIPDGLEPDGGLMFFNKILVTLPSLEKIYISEVTFRKVYRSAYVGYCAKKGKKVSIVHPESMNEARKTLGLNKHVQKKFTEKRVEDHAEDISEVSEDMIRRLYDLWGHVTVDYQNDVVAGKPMRLINPDLKIDVKIGKSYEKFISDMTDGEMRFTYNNHWGQESLNAIEFWDYRERKNIRSWINRMYGEILYWPEFKQKFITNSPENMILDWFIPATCKVLKEHPEFRAGFYRKLRM